MQTMKIDKRINEEVAGLRKLAAYLPAGKARALLNKCGKIERYASKAQAMVDAPTGSLFPSPEALPKYEPTNEDIAARESRNKAIFAALLAGRRISLENAAEFKVSQMHTQIAVIRRKIEDQRLPYTLCAQEKRPDPKRRGYNEYYLIPKDDE